MKVTKYYRVWQGKHDKDGKYHEFGGFQRQSIEELLELLLAEEISKDVFEGRAKWGSGHYSITKTGVVESGPCDFDSSG